MLLQCPLILITMDSQIAKYLLGTVQTPKELAPTIDLLKLHLSLDNNKLREDFDCSL